MSKFDKIKVSTQTIIVDTNVKYNIENIFNRIPRETLPETLAELKDDLQSCSLDENKIDGK